MGVQQSEDDFTAALSRLNALCGVDDRWIGSQARTRHYDAFGVEVLPGEVYYHREPAQGPSSTLKLSRRSMGLLLILVVVSCPSVENIADALLGDERERLRKFVVRS